MGLGYFLCGCSLRSALGTTVVALVYFLHFYWVYKGEAFWLEVFLLFV